jgi:hypothetical protein
MKSADEFMSACVSYIHGFVQREWVKVSQDDQQKREDG